VTLLLPTLAAAGLTIFIFGLPLFRTPRLTQRVDPYVTGLHGRPSALLDSGGRSGGGPLRAWIQARSNALGRGSDRHLEERLAAAGEDLTASGFRMEQLTWGVVASVGAWSFGVAIVISRIEIDPRTILPLSVIAFALGWLGRDWWLGRKIEERRSSLQDELPTAIDLVTLSIMAGESVPAALDRCSRLLGTGIGTELGIVVADIRAGSPAVEALYSFKRRLSSGSRMIRFVDALVTAIERGSPLAEVLIAQSDDTREERRRRLIESGGRREILMLIPVVFLILPVVVVFALLPGLVSLNLLVP
jgi:tight adherence protein C